MTIISADIFSGGTDTDIDGRVPDGGTVGAAVGAWDGPQLGAAQVIGITALGAQSARDLATDDRPYAVTGLPANLVFRPEYDDYTVRVVGSFTPDSSGLSWFSAWSRITTDFGDLYGYQLSLERQGGGFPAALSLYQVSQFGAPPIFYPLATIEIPDIGHSADHTIELSHRGLFLWARLDGQVLIDPFYNSGGGASFVGLPGFSMTNTDTAVAKNVVVRSWELDDVVLPSSPCAGV